MTIQQTKTNCSHRVVVTPWKPEDVPPEMAGHPTTLLDNPSVARIFPGMLAGERLYDRRTALAIASHYNWNQLDQWGWDADQLEWAIAFEVQDSGKFSGDVPTEEELAEFGAADFVDEKVTEGPRKYQAADYLS